MVLAILIVILRMTGHFPPFSVWFTFCIFFVDYALSGLNKQVTSITVCKRRILVSSQIYFLYSSRPHTIKKNK